MSVATVVPLTQREDERRLFERRDSDPLARAALIESKLALAISLAHRYTATRGEAEDLRQVAALGLVKAVDRFDPARGIAFSSFAVPTIIGEIRRHIRDTKWALRVSRGLQEAAMQMVSATDELTSSLGRSPSIGELADATGATRERVVEALAVARARYPESLDAPTKDDDTVDRHDLVGDYDERLETADSRETARDIVRRLPEEHRTLLRMRFEEDLTQAQIAQRLGVSQMHVSRLLRAALDRASVLAAA